jgi:anti-sigma regulatory factor (Ser/Thr protein kinase)
MTRRVRARGEDIRSFILRNIGKDAITAKAAEHFGITRQAVNLHLQNLVDEGALLASGNTRSRVYALASAGSVSFMYVLTADLQEDVVWRKDIQPYLGVLPSNVVDIWRWAFTEMLNNAIDHSAGTHIYVTVSKTALDTEISVADDGVGIFTKIQRECGLQDERQAIFELSKGKLTTDSKKHSGQGIFFTSHMVSGFDILSGGVYFSHATGSEHDWMLERKAYKSGTTVFLRVENYTSRSVQKTLRSFNVGDTYDFNKTIVPVSLAKYGLDQLVSRSQAKRVLARVELFSQVIFDFTGVDMIGPAFADEIFRVFQLEHPNVTLLPSHTNPEIRGMITAAIKAGRPGFEEEVLS